MYKNSSFVSYIYTFEFRLDGFSLDIRQGVERVVLRLKRLGDFSLVEVSWFETIDFSHLVNLAESYEYLGSIEEQGDD